MLLRELRDLIRIRIDDIRKVDYTDSQLLTLIQAAHRKLYNDFLRFRVYFSVSSTTLEITTQETELPTNCQRVLTLQHNDSKGHKFNIADAESVIAGSSNYFYVLNSLLIFNNEVTSPFNVFMRYAPRLTPIPSVNIADDYEIIEVPKQFQDLLVSWATVLALGKDEDNVKFWVSMYEKEFMDAIEIAKPQNEHDSHVVDVIGGVWQ